MRTEKELLFSNFPSLFEHLQPPSTTEAIMAAEATQQEQRPVRYGDLDDDEVGQVILRHRVMLID